MDLILHITTARQWSAAQATGEYRAESLDVDGFIHCSTRDQVAGVANELYAGHEGLVVLVIDPARLEAEVRFEDCYETSQDFPHIYGPVPAKAVIQVIDFTPGPDGGFSRPSL